MTNKKANAVVPLTLAQLGQMDGQPVYIQILHTGEGRWGLLKALGECVAEILMPDGKTSYHLIDLYGKTWTAYAYPPIQEMAERLRGEWQPTEYPYMNECEECSVCGYRTAWGHKFKFCPSCGRAMTPEAWAELEKRIGGDTE